MWKYGKLFIGKGGKIRIFCSGDDLALFTCNGTKVNKYSKFDTNFDIQRQLDHFEYEMIHALKCLFQFLNRYNKRIKKMLP